MSYPPVVLTIAGSDSSAGAGLQADLKTFAAHGVYGVCAVTALVAEVPGEVARISPVDLTLFGLQINRVRSAFPLSGVKTGMLHRGEIVREVVAFCREHPGLPLIVDPVIRSGSGSALLDGEGLEILKRDLLPLARLITPNLPEAEALLGHSISAADFSDAPRQLHERYGCDVLLKAGHLASEGARITDLAWIDGSLQEFSRARLAVPDVHGTGCTLSAAILARIARGESMDQAISGAAAYLAAALAGHHVWNRDGKQVEALNHFPDAVD